MHILHLFKSSHGLCYIASSVLTHNIKKQFHIKMTQITSYSGELRLRLNLSGSFSSFSTCKLKNKKTRSGYATNREAKLANRFRAVFKFTVLSCTLPGYSLRIISGGYIPFFRFFSFLLYITYLYYF